MHPWVAVWIWSMTMSRVWQNALSQQGLLADNENTRADARQRPLPIIVNASDYLKTDIVEQILPDLILDRLAELHWMEREPALAI